MPKFQMFESPVDSAVVNLKLEPRDGGGVLLVVCNADGSREDHSQILSIREDGRLHLKGNLNSDLGVPIGNDGCIEQD
jgi:hypothetical protein